MFVPTRYLPNPHDPFREPDLRWRRCRYLVRHRCQPSPAHDDDATRDGWRYLHDRRACQNRTDRKRLAQRHPAVAAARRLVSRAAPLRRAEVEARLLARQADETIAAQCGLSAAAVGAYHDLFFSVRDALDAEVYILNVVIGPKIYYGLKPDDCDVLLKIAGYTLGASAVNELLAYWADPPILPASLEQLDDAALESLRAKLLMQTWILSLTLPADADTAARLPRPSWLSCASSPIYSSEPRWSWPVFINMIAEHGGRNMNANTQIEQTKTAANEDIAELLGRAEKGDATVLPQLRRLLDESPELWRGYGNLALQARASWVQLTAGANLLMAESLLRKAAELLKEVAGASPSPLENLLAERVVVCWLQVSFYDSLIAQTREYTPAKMRMLQQQHDAAQRRYLSAMKTLATVRKLVTPSRSPIEIASKLAGERSGLRLREVPVTAGVPVEN